MNIEGWDDDWDRDHLARLEEAFRQAQQHELRILDLFIKHRDEILANISRAKTFEQLTQHKVEADAVFGEGERQANSFKYFGDRFWSLLSLSQSRLTQSLQIAQARIQGKQQRQSDYRAEQALRDQRNREHQESLRKSQQDISDIYASINKSQRESADRRNKMWMATQFPDRYCPRCGDSKLYGHLYCLSCHPHRHSL